MTPRSGARTPTMLCAWLLCLAAATVGRAHDDLASSEAVVVAGQLSRLDLVDSSVWLRLDGGAAELQLRVDPQSARISRSGRIVRFEDIQPGERAIAVYAVEAQQPAQALVLKLGRSRHATP